MEHDEQEALRVERDFDAAGVAAAQATVKGLAGLGHRVAVAIVLVHLDEQGEGGAHSIISSFGNRPQQWLDIQSRIGYSVAEMLDRAEAERQSRSSLIVPGHIQ